MSSCNYSIVTDRDKKVLDMVEQLKVIDLFVADTLFFSDTKGTRVAQRRLTTLCEYKKLKRWRPNQISPYIYYLGKRPLNVDHAILVSRFIAHLKLLGAEILKLKREWLIHEGIRIDLFVAYRLNNKNYISIVEVENTKSFDAKLQKLEEYYLSNQYKNLFPNFPQVVCISSKPYKDNKVINVIKLKTDFSNMEELLKYL